MSPKPTSLNRGAGGRDAGLLAGGVVDCRLYYGDYLCRPVFGHFDHFQPHGCHPGKSARHADHGFRLEGLRLCAWSNAQLFNTNVVPPNYTDSFYHSA